MKNRPSLSLCMPTNGVIEWVFPVLESIYQQNVENTLFEVVITDNGDNLEFKEKIKAFANNHSNIIYSETNVPPFINEIESYKLANGVLIKFVNHRTKLLEGALKKLIDFAENNKNERPEVYFSNGVLKIEKVQHVYNSFDEYINTLSYWSSWSTGMAIWKKDFEKLPEDVSTYNELFPHTNVLFNERDKSKYIIDNTVLMYEISPGTIPKGKYDIFYAFAVEYPAIILELYRDESINLETFNSVKHDNMMFISELYLHFCLRKIPCSYDLSSFNQSVSIFYKPKKVKIFIIKIIIDKIIDKIKRLKR